MEHNTLSLFFNEVERHFLQPVRGSFLGHMPMDVFVKDNVFTALVELPGVPADAVTVTLEGRDIKVKAVKDDEQEGSGYREIRRGVLERSLRLHPQAESEKLKATFAQGMLTLTAPLKEEATARVIPLEAPEEEDWSSAAEGQEKEAPVEE